MAQQELDLIQLAACQVAEPRASAPKIVRRELLNACTPRALADDLPQDLWSHSVAPDFTSLVDRFSRMDRSDTERQQLAAAKSASDQYGEDCVVPFAT